MPKNIVICCDGTGNEIATDFTNVFRLFHVLVHDSPEQVTFYLPGVGTMEAPGMITPVGRRLSMIADQGSGLGVYLNVERVIAFLMQNYVPGDKFFSLDLAVAPTPCR